MHLGNVRTFMIAWLSARSRGGRVLLRIEDLDHPKNKPGAETGIMRDLEWLGFDWDSSCVQSRRLDLYRDALSTLRAKSLVYPCVCSRRDVEAAQSAPHEGEQLFYPGTCRGRFGSWEAAAAVRPPCWRFRIEGDPAVEFDDMFAGAFSQRPARALGDFPLARDRYGAGYTLAAAVDDAETGVTEVVRGDDLLPATPAQILVARALGLRSPRYCHVPLVTGPDGRRLAKRHGDTRISALRLAGRRPEEITGMLAASCGWIDRGEEIRLGDLVPLFRLDAVPRRPFCPFPV